MKTKRRQCTEGQLMGGHCDGQDILVSLDAEGNPPGAYVRMGRRYLLKGTTGWGGPRYILEGYEWKQK